MIYTIEITNQNGGLEFHMHIDEMDATLKKKQAKMQEVSAALNTFLTRLSELEKEAR